MKFKKYLGLEWDAIAGITAAIVAIILHFFHVVDEQVILPIILVLMALLFINCRCVSRNRYSMHCCVQR
ncbi:MAG: hypothetical protein RQ736_06260 [Thiogranum sp.]|nr:hypothetical protein [Thiogranum sp.]